MIKVVKYQPSQKILAVFLMALLVLLTSINFFRFNTNLSDSSYALALAAEDQTEEPGSNTNPNGPDEKAPGNAFSFSEEYLHDHQETADLISDQLIHQRLLVLNKLHPAHLDLITPPPDYSC